MDSMWVLLILTNQQQQQKKNLFAKSNMQIPFFSGFTSLSCRKFIFNFKQRGEFVLDFITHTVSSSEGGSNVFFLLASDVDA